MERRKQVVGAVMLAAVVVAAIACPIHYWAVEELTVENGQTVVKSTKVFGNLWKAPATPPGATAQFLWSELIRLVALGVISGGAVAWANRRKRAATSPAVT